MKHLCFLKRIVFFTLLTVCASSYAQTVKFIDAKGTSRELGNVAEIDDATGGQVINESLTLFSAINFSTPGIVDLVYYTRSASSITIAKSGRYEITYRVSTQTTNGNINAGEFYLEVNGTQSPGTKAYTYSDALAFYDTVTVTKIIDVTVANTVIKVKGRVYYSSLVAASLVKMAKNGSSLIVKRIR